MNNIYCLLLFFSFAYSELQIGEPAPEFNLAGQNSEFHSLSQYNGKFVILYFYPRDNTPGCTREACSFRDRFNDFSELGAVILGISYDDEKSHSRFAEKHSLPFQLLSDKKGLVSKAYDAYGWFLPKRKTVIISPDGIILKIIEQVSIETQSEEILQFIKKIQMNREIHEKQISAP